MNRRNFLLRSLSLLVTSKSKAESPAAGVADAPTRGMLLGLSGINYYNGFSPFLNWAKVMSILQLNTINGILYGQDIWDKGGYLAPNTGELMDPVPSDVVSFIITPWAKVQTAYQYNLGDNFDGEPWICSWDGQASVTVNLFDFGNPHPGFQNPHAPASKSPIRFTMAVPQARGFSITFAVTPGRRPPTNIKIYQARYAANVTRGEMFNPDWLAEVRKFDVLRFMDWQGTNGSTIADFSQLADTNYTAWCSNFTSTTINGSLGPKGSQHPNLFCQLANLTRRNIHVCFPHMATDAFVTAFVSYCKANTSVEVSYEYSNECWNGPPLGAGFAQAQYCLTQGLALFNNQSFTGYISGRTLTVLSGGLAIAQQTITGTGVSANTIIISGPAGGGPGDYTINRRQSVGSASSPVNFKGTVVGFAAQTYARDMWYGYQASRLMNIIKSIYNDSSRWRGVLGSFVLSTATTQGHIAGFNYWKAINSSSLNYADLFKSVYVTGYFGDFIPNFNIGPPGITNANPGVVNAVGHPYNSGDVLRMLVPLGPGGLDNTDITVTKIDANRYSIGVDTSAMASMTALTSCRLATAAVLPNTPTYNNGASGQSATLTGRNNSTLIVDGIVANLNDRILVQNQASSFQNGIYSVSTAGSGATPWVLTRATDFNSSSEMKKGAWFYVTAGNTQVGTYYLSADVTTVGTSTVGFTNVAANNTTAPYQFDYTVYAKLWQMMDQSLANNIASPATYPTKYTYFNQQMATSLLTGACSFGYVTSQYLFGNIDVNWKNQLAIAQSVGLTLRQYEGGSSFAGAAFLVGQAENAQFNEYLFNFSWSQEIANVYSASFNRFRQIGGEYPAKFTEGGLISSGAPWSGVRYWPTVANGNTNDTGNPVWQSTLAAR